MGLVKWKGDVCSGTTRGWVCLGHVYNNLLQGACIDYHFANDDVGEFLKF
jgi:hypothetical protein